MATITTEVEVNIELDKFNTEDILAELKYRIKHRKIDEWEVEDVKTICREISVQNEGESAKNFSLIDAIKIESFMQGKDKKTLQEIENFFNT